MITANFPAAWRCTVTVHRSGGTDRKGNALPATTHEVRECLVSTQRSVEEPTSRSDGAETSAYLYAPAGADFAATDQVEVPPSPERFWPSGMFQVSGEPDFGPLGVRVPLRRP